MPRPTFTLLNGGRSAAEPLSAADQACWLLLQNVERPSEPRALSKRAGLPYWPEAEPWPLCASCKAPLDFIMQLRTDAAHALFPGPLGMLVLLVCLRCRPFYDAQQRRFAVRRFPINPDTPLLPELGVPLPPSPVASMALDLRPAPDAPSGLEAAHASTLSVAQRLLLLENDVCEKRDKVGGFPAFLDAPTVPPCPRCQSRPRFLLQLNGQPEGGFVWAPDAAGRLFLFGCEQGHDWEYTLLAQSE